MSRSKYAQETIVFIVGGVIVIEISLGFVLSGSRYIYSYAAIRSLAHHICAVILDKNTPNGWCQERLASGAVLTLFRQMAIRVLGI
jgi:hypothetical protein